VLKTFKDLLKLKLCEIPVLANNIDRASSGVNKSGELRFAVAADK